MARYAVSIDFGSGATDCTSYLVGQYPVKRHRILHNALRPSIGTCRFSLHRNTALINQFVTASTDPEVTITKDGAPYFTGTIRKTVKISVGQLQVDALECQCVDVLYRMDRKKVRTSIVWSGYKISDPTTKTASILHQLFYLAGYADAELNLTAIDTVVDKYVADGTGKALSLRGLIEEVLRDTVYTVRPSVHGVIELYHLCPATYTPTATLATGSGGNIAEGYSFDRDEFKSEAVDVTYWTHKALDDQIVFEDTQGATATQPCVIILGAGEYFPDGAASGKSVRAEYKITDYELVAVDSPALQWDHTGDVALQDSTADGMGMLLRFYSATGGVITKLRIVGDATVKDAKCKAEAEIVASSEERETIETDTITTKTAAERIANGRAAWHKNAIYRYHFKRITLTALSSDTLYPGLDLYPSLTLYPWGDVLLPGDIVTLADAVLLGATQTLRVLEVIDGADPKTFEVICEGVGEYTASPTAGNPIIAQPTVPLKFPALKSLANDPAGATPDTVDYDGQHAVYGGIQYIGTTPTTWVRDDAGQTTSEVAAAVPVYVPGYLGAHLDAAPTATNPGDKYLRYSATSGDANRGVFVWDGSAYNRSTNPADLYAALSDIVAVCMMYNTDGTATLYGTEADYGITVSIPTAHIRAAIIDILRVGNLTISGLLKSPTFDTIAAQAGETVNAPTPTYWPGSELIDLCAGLSEAWHAVDSASTLDSKTVTHCVKGGTAETPAYQDAAATYPSYISITSGVLGKVKPWVTANGGYCVLYKNSVQIAVIDGLSATPKAFNETEIAVGDVLLFQHYGVGEMLHAWVSPAANTIGVYNSTDSTVLVIDDAGYYNVAGTINIASGTLATASIDTYWKGSELINDMSPPLRRYVTNTLGGGTFNSKTCATAYIGTTSLLLTYASGADDTISQDGYYNLTGSIILPTVEGKILIGDPTAEGQYEIWPHNIPGTSNMIITFRNTNTGELHTITETRAPDVASGDSEATHSLHAVVGTDDYVRDLSLHNYAGPMCGLDVLSNFGGDSLGDWKHVAKRTVIAWEASTAYSVGDIRSNDGNAYDCISAGTSAASGGPTGTGAFVVDNTIRWQYLGTVTDGILELAIKTLDSKSGAMHTAGGRIPTGSIHAATYTRNSVFEAITPALLDVDDVVIVSGAIGTTIISKAQRISASRVDFYGIDAGTLSVIQISYGSTTTVNTQISIAW